MSLQLQNKAKALKGKQQPNHAQQQAAETLGQIISPLRQIQTCMLQCLKLLILYYAPCTPKNHSHQHHFPCFSLGPAGDAPASKLHLVCFFIFLGLVATLFVRPFGFAIVLAISLQKVKDTTQLILVHQDQKIC